MRSGSQIPVAEQLCAVTLNPRIDLQQVQRKDPALQKLIAFKTAKRNKPEFREWAGDSVLRRFWYQYVWVIDKLVRSRWLDIGLVPFLRVYGPRLRLGP